jgi:hypothetical protein
MLLHFQALNAAEPWRILRMGDQIGFLSANSVYGHDIPRRLPTATKK